MQQSRGASPSTSSRRSCTRGSPPPAPTRSRCGTLPAGPARKATWPRHAPAGEQRDEDDLAGGGYERVALAVMRALAGGVIRPWPRPGRVEAQLILNTPQHPSLHPAAPAAGTAPQAAIPGLPADAVVEVPCMVTPDGALPLAQQAPPGTQLDLLRRVKDVERLTVRAATHGDRAAAARAFARHPLVDSEELAGGAPVRLRARIPGARALWRGSGAAWQGVVFYRVRTEQPGQARIRAGGRKEGPWH